MPMPPNVKIVDLMMAIPVSETNQEWYRQFAPLLMDAESREQFKMPAQYLFKDIPRLAASQDYVRFLVEQMDLHGIDVALVGYFRRLARRAVGRGATFHSASSSTPDKPESGHGGDPPRTGASTPSSESSP
jgi:hypothetical protein